MIVVPEIDDLNHDSAERLRENTTVTNPYAGGPADGLVNSFNSVAQQLFTALREGEISASISQAYGRDLDEIGNLLGFSRVGATHAEDLSTSNFRFYLDPALGTNYFSQLIERINTHFGDEDQIAMPGGQLDFPIGITITSSTNSDVQYKTTSAGYIDADTNESYVNVVSTNPGVDGNIGVGALDTWDATGYPYLYQGRSAIICGNKQDITSGQEEMNDSEYKYFLSNRVTAAANANRTAIRLAALSVPGVSDVIIKKWTHGVGTFTVMPISAATIISQGILSSVESIVEEATAFGNKVHVIAPLYIGIKARVDVDFKINTKSSDKTKVKNQIRTAIVNYINNIVIGGELILTNIITLAKNVSEEVRDVQIVKLGAGDLNTTTFQLQRYEPLIHTNQLLRYNEKFYTNATFIEVCDF